MEAMALQAQIDEENRKIAEERFAHQQQEETKRRLEEKKKVKFLLIKTKVCDFNLLICLL